MTEPGDDNTSITLREYIDLLNTTTREDIRFIVETHTHNSALVAQGIELRFGAIKDSTALASKNLDAKLEQMNHMRTQIDQMTGTYPTRVEIEAKIDTVMSTVKINSDRIRIEEQKSANLDGRFWAVGAGASVLAVIVSVALHFIK